MKRKTVKVSSFEVLLSMEVFHVTAAVSLVTWDHTVLPVTQPK